MIKEHFTFSDSFVIEHMDYKQETFKPNGIWYQIDGSWESWVSIEMPDWLVENNNKYELDIDMSNVLVLDTLDKMYSFNTKYKVLDGERLLFESIDWNRLSLDYDGIEIPFYMYSLRMNADFHWYYSWDVASGCIWNTSIIKIK